HPNTAPSGQPGSSAQPATSRRAAQPNGAPTSGDAAAASKTNAASNDATSPSVPAASQSANEVTRDSQILTSGEAPPMFDTEAAPSDPLTIGGQLYLRLQSTASKGQGPSEFTFSSPSMLDVYMDARPNERVRGFVRGRMVYDATLPTSGSSSTATTAVPATGSTSGSQSLSSLFQPQTRDPKVYLDQLWLNFDISRTLFVTAGKQHVRWGTARFWAPTDFLHLRPRNPLDVFDARTGSTMIKVHLPIESKQWNFYAYGLTEGPNATSTLGSLAGAARAEFVFGTTEVGLGALARRHNKPKFALDLSTGIYDFDVYGEMALRTQGEVDRVRYDANATIPDAPVNPPSWLSPAERSRDHLEEVVDALYPLYRRQGYRPQVVGGINYSRKYNDNDTFTIGTEYFYNPFGYASPTAYPGLVLPHTRDLSESANFFYLGRHYGAIYVTFPAPYKLDNHTFTLSTLGNLSDQSYITRFDYAFILLTHLRFEAFVSGRYGSPHGEFRFGVNQLNLGEFQFSRPAALMDMGVALRMAM
ncbi:MAG TPA: hypothetical protein VIV60_32680, partial [Polyangiaceae bacterium]